MVITVENERFCPSVVTDKIHLPSTTVPFSVPAIIYVTEGGLGIESSGSGVLLGRVINGSGSLSKTIEVKIHAKLRGLAVSKSVAGPIQPYCRLGKGTNLTLKYEGSV